MPSSIQSSLDWSGYSFYTGEKTPSQDELYFSSLAGRIRCIRSCIYHIVIAPITAVAGAIGGLFMGIVMAAFAAAGSTGSEEGKEKLMFGVFMTSCGVGAGAGLLYSIANLFAAARAASGVLHPAIWLHL